MADEFESDQDKTEDPSQHRIDEFRKRGEVASSKELNSVLVLSACILALMLSLVYIYETLGEFVQWLYTLDVAFAYTEKSFKTIVTKTAVTGFKCIAPVMSTAMCVGIIANVAQIGFLFSTEVLEFKPERINPLAGIKRLLSMKSMVEAIKAVFKFIFVMGIVYYVVKDDINSFQGYFHVSFVEGFMHARFFMAKIAFSIIGSIGIIAIADFAYQKISYQNKLKMTKEQAKKESKEQDGNPEVKQRIRAIQREMATQRMMSDIPNADVVVTNPTHFAVVLKYDPEGMVSPQVMGKGADHLALKIREIAKKHNVPVVENVPLARALYKTSKVGEYVPRNLYKAVAEVLAFVYKLKRKQKAIS
ncbi:MAG: flagellar biosynthesis protein FlhB [Bacteriovoracaceae bacterium]|nr:flagellar biosynthesis protein FlhB [Bacteriovoracaceae bacterium]